MADDRQRVAALLPGYDLGEEIGRGGWGVVYAAEHRTLQRRVAIKQLTGGLGDEEARARFRSEARVVASLDHPHVVPLYDFVEHDDMCVFVMELMTGGTLHERVEAGMLPAPTACAIALGVLGGLHHAHRNGVLHRDVKPDNVLFSSTDRPKLADFGIAKIVDDVSGTRTATGTILGTPAYMAPEQAGAEVVGPATDLYSTGVVLYELLAGRLPFESTGNAMSQLYRHVYEAPRPLRQLGAPVALDEVVMRALAKEPAERFDSAAAFADALDRAATAAFGAGWLEQSAVPVLGGRASRDIARSTSTPAPAPVTPAAPAPFGPPSSPSTDPPTAGSAAPAPVRAPAPAATPPPVAAGPAVSPAEPSSSPAGAPDGGSRGERSSGRTKVALGIGAVLVAAAVAAALVLGGRGATDPEQADRPAETTTTSAPAFDLVAAEERFLEACERQLDADLCRCGFDTASEELTEAQLRANDELIRTTGDDLTAEFVAVLERCAEG